MKSVLWVIKNQLQKLGCLLGIALIGLLFTGITKFLLGLFHFNETERDSIGNNVGEYIMKGLLGLAILGGFTIMAFSVIASIRDKKTAPPPLPQPVPPRTPPIVRQASGAHESESKPSIKSEE